MATFGEFYDALGKWVEENSNYMALSFLDLWPNEVHDIRWRERELSELHILEFAGSAAGEFISILRGTCTDAAYSDRIQCGHEFLRTIAKTATQMGVEIEIHHVDTPLSISDALVMGQARKGSA